MFYNEMYIDLQYILFVITELGLDKSWKKMLFLYEFCSHFFEWFLNVTEVHVFTL